jgi:hypothetical protein
MGALDRIKQASISAGEAESLDSAVTHTYLTVLGRSPAPEEVREVRSFLSEYQLDYSAQRDSAKEWEEISQKAATRYESAIRPTVGLLGYYRSLFKSFDGIGDLMRIDLPPQTASNADAITIELWLRPDEVRTATVACCDDPDGRLWRTGIEASQLNGHPVNRVFYEFYSPNAGGRVVADGPAAVVPVGKYSHLLASFGGGMRRLYLNGVLVHEQQTTGALRPFNVPFHVPLTIGARGDRNEWFRGRVDHVAVYDRALDAAEAQRHYGVFQEFELPKQDFGRLAAWRAFCQTLLCSNEFFYVE